MTKQELIDKWSIVSKGHKDASVHYRKLLMMTDKVRSLKHESIEAVIDAILEDVETLIDDNEIVELQNRIDSTINELDIVTDSEVIQYYGSISSQLTKILKL